MKIFISYRFSDVEKTDLENLITPIYNSLKLNHKVFCNFYKDQHYIDNNYTAKEIMQDCFENIDSSDTVLCLVDTNKYSCGMLLEIGYSLAQHKRIIVCSRQGCEIDTLCQMATYTISYADYDELLKKLTL